LVNTEFVLLVIHKWTYSCDAKLSGNVVQWTRLQRMQEQREALIGICSKCITFKTIGYGEC